jgi:hypothetical protein
MHYNAGGASNRGLTGYDTEQFRPFSIVTDGYWIPLYYRQSLGHMNCMIQIFGGYSHYKETRKDKCEVTDKNHEEVIRLTVHRPKEFSQPRYCSLRKFHKLLYERIFVPWSSSQLLTCISNIDNTSHEEETSKIKI